MTPGCCGQQSGFFRTPRRKFDGRLREPLSGKQIREDTRRRLALRARAALTCAPPHTKRSSAIPFVIVSWAASAAVAAATVAAIVLHRRTACRCDNCHFVCRPHLASASRHRLRNRPFHWNVSSEEIVQFSHTTTINLVLLCLIRLWSGCFIFCPTAFPWAGASGRHFLRHLTSFRCESGGADEGIMGDMRNLTKARKPSTALRHAREQGPMTTIGGGNREEKIDYRRIEI